MGADISFYDNDGTEVFYFRDAYDDANLAWMRGLSYWAMIGKPVEVHIAFFEQLAGITDEEIATHMVPSDLVYSFGGPALDGLQPI